MNFDESVKYLYALGNEVLTMKLGLETTETLLGALGNPERNFLKIQIAGTNGKGSTCAFLDAICQDAQIKTGLFTSPHLISITERIKINGAEISEANFAKHATTIKNLSEKLIEEKTLDSIPTFFEQMTAIAISAFNEAKIELAILETGLGGRFDSVTATRAEIVAITPIDFDHQEILGNTLSEIAREKAAIIRADTKVVLAMQSVEAEKVLAAVCANFGVAPKLAQTAHAELISDSKFEISNKSKRVKINLETKKAKYENVELSLRGRHQIENATVAVLLAEILQERFLKITTENIVKGLQTAVHKGRLEFYQGILFDGAHNVGGAKALRNYIEEFAEQPITLIFGAMREKDLKNIAETLFPKAEFLIFTKADNPRSLETIELLDFVPANFNRENVFQAETVEAALKIAEDVSGKENLICVTGSLYLVGEARKLLNNKI